MNQDVFAGKWKHIRGELKSWWGKLAEDDFDRIGGQKDKLIGVIQEKYGYTREKAQREVEEHLKDYGDTMDGPSGNGKRDAVPHEGAIATAKTAVAEGLEWAEGAVAAAKTAVADGVESASSYLQERKFEDMATDLTAMIRRYPVQSLVVGVGLGYLLARLTTR